MQYKPTWLSFLGSAAFALSPAVTAGAVTFFVWENASPILLMIAGALMAVLSLYLLLQATFVHLQRLYVDEQTISVAGPLDRKQIMWSEVHDAVLKERENVMTRTDHLLILRARNSLVVFNTSTLSESDEEYLLAFVRRKTNLVVEQSRPSI